MNRDEIIKFKNNRWYRKTYGSLISKWVYIQRHDLYDDSIRYEKHHIIPRSLGGSDLDTNLVKVPLRVHIILHQLLLCIYPEIEGIIYSANMMMSTRNGRLPNTRIASWTRELMSKIRKEHAEERLAAARRTLTGRKRPDYERKHISEGRYKMFSNLSPEKRLKLPGFKGHHTEESKRKISEKNSLAMSRKTLEEKAVVGRRVSGPDGKIFESISEASRYYKIPNTTLGDWVRNGKNGFNLSEPNPDKAVIKQIQGPDGTIYSSLRECSRVTGHTVGTLRKWSKSNPEMGYKILL